MPSISKVMASGACSGCGGCSVLTGGRIEVRLTPFGVRQAQPGDASEADLAAASRVCPFADESPDEDEVAAQVLASANQYDSRVGRYLSISAAQVSDDDYLIGSSSGGLTSWVVGALLMGGDIDGVLHVGQSDDGLFGYTASYDLEAVRSRRKSAYISTSFDEVLLRVRGDGRRYAIVGVPCFITAARHLAREDEVLRGQLAFFVGLVCGHLKSSGFAELLAWQTGVEPSRLAAVDFRVKEPGRDAGDYAFGARAIGEERWRTAPQRQLLGANWGHAMFQLGACDFCDDIFAETADVVLGDAWLDAYRDDWRGTNVVITRSPRIQELLDRGAQRGEVRLEPLSVESAARSQAGNFRHRRDGLAVRLADDQAAGVWTPRKRVAADLDRVPPQRRALVRQRRLIARRSHTVFARAREVGSLALFTDTMRPEIDTYTRIDLGPLMGTLAVRAPKLAQSRLLRNRAVRKLLSRRRSAASSSSQ